MDLTITHHRVVDITELNDLQDLYRQLEVKHLSLKADLWRLYKKNLHPEFATEEHEQQGFIQAIRAYRKELLKIMQEAE